MKLRTVAPHFLVLSSVLAAGCCGGLGYMNGPEYAKDNSFDGAAAMPAAAASEPECALCAALGLDFNSDAAVIGAGFIADRLHPSGLGAEANFEIGQGSGDDSGTYNPGDFLGKTAGYGSDYKVVRGSLHARYPIPMGNDSEVKFVPLAGLGYYRWSDNNCDDFTRDLGFCSDDSITLDVGAEVEWKRFGVKVWVPVSGDSPDAALRLRYHLPIGGGGG